MTLISNQNRHLELNQARTTDGKFNYILRKKPTSTQWLKLEENCKYLADKDELANWFNLSPTADFLKPYAVVDLKDNEDEATVVLQVRRFV